MGLVLETKTARIPKYSVGKGFQQSFGTLPTLLTLLHSEEGNQRLKYQSQGSYEWIRFSKYYRNIVHKIFKTSEHYLHSNDYLHS